MQAIDSSFHYVREAMNVLDAPQSAQGGNSIHIMKLIIQLLKETHRIAEEILIQETDQLRLFLQQVE